MTREQILARIEAKDAAQARAMSQLRSLSETDFDAWAKRKAESGSLRELAELEAAYGALVWPIREAGNATFADVAWGRAQFIAIEVGRAALRRSLETSLVA